MTLYQLAAYHNNDSRFMAYQDGQRLTAAMSCRCDLPATDEPEAVADWAWHVFNADLILLEPSRNRPGGELTFLAACVYRLLQLRSLSVGDVLQVATDTQTWWLACETFGWRHIDPPSNLEGQPLTAEKVYQHLHAQRTR